MAVFVEPEQDWMKRSHRIKNNSSYAEIQYRFMFTSCASAQPRIDYNECELPHSETKKTGELNKGQITLGLESIIPNIPDEIN